jgi:hypothetical protein
MTTAGNDESWGCIPRMGTSILYYAEWAVEGIWHALERVGGTLLGSTT